LFLRRRAAAIVSVAFTVIRGSAAEQGIWSFLPAEMNELVSPTPYRFIKPKA
jgi:hypothetical protein